MSKIEPSVQTIVLSSPSITAPNVGEFTVDLSQIASLMNRRFYRQGINWAVAGIKILTIGDGVVQVKKLPNTWVMSNAWEKGFRAWQRMNNEALEENESVRPRFLDFKIYADSVHHAAGFGANLLPLDGANPAVPYIVGEWEPSKYEIPTGTAGAQGATGSREVVAVGRNYPGFGASGLDAVSLIEGYAASRGLPNVLDPNAPADADDADGFNPANWISATFNDGTNQIDNVLQDMISENNIAPYPFENDGINTDTMYPNGANQAPTMQIHDLAFVSPTSIGGMTRLKGGNFPCGLMRFDWAPTDSTSNLSIVIDLVPGNHRGYLCEPMTEM